LNKFFIFNLHTNIVATPFWGKCEVATHTPENGTWESSRTPENSKRDCRDQNTLHQGVLYTVGNVLKCRCPKWPRMSHLDICQRRAESQTASLTPNHYKSGIDPILVGAGRVRHTVGKLSRRATSSRQTWSQSEVGAKNYERPKSREFKPGQFRDSTLGVLGQRAIWVWAWWSNAENTVWGKVVASPSPSKSRLWWVKWVRVACPNT
jgi:hypothetical protein